MLKKSLSVLMAILLLASAFTMFSYAERGLSYTAPKGTPVIDGKADDIWDAAEWTEVKYPHDGSDKSAIPESLRVKLLWDDTNLYFLAEVTDADLNYENDLVEVYYDGGNEKAETYDENDTQTRFRWDGTVIQDSGTNCQNDAEAAGVQNDTGWITEGALKHTIAPKEGQTCGLEFMFNVGGSEADFTAALRWNVDTVAGDAAPYLDTSKWGTLVLGAAPVVVTEAPETEAPETEAPETEAPETDAPEKAPTEAAQTGDAVISVVALVALAAAGTIYVGKKRK